MVLQWASNDPTNTTTGYFGWPKEHPPRYPTIIIYPKTHDSLNPMWHIHINIYIVRCVAMLKTMFSGIAENSVNWLLVGPRQRWAAKPTAKHTHITTETALYRSDFVCGACWRSIYSGLSRTRSVTSPLWDCCAFVYTKHENDDTRPFRNEKPHLLFFNAHSKTTVNRVVCSFVQFCTLWLC